MLLKFICLAGLLSSALGHGRLWWPPARATMWRHGFDNPPHWTDHELYCGGFSRQWHQNGGKCGECGDPWDIPVGQRENQAGGTYANGIISDTYKAGQLMDIEVDLTANHMGWFEFRLCANNDPTKAITHDCLNEHLLELADGSSTRWYLPNQSYGMKYITVRLPSDLTCSQCVLQWKYQTANTWDCDDDGTCCNGCGPQEQFYGCSDIAITGDGGQATTTSTQAPQSTTTQAQTTTSQAQTTTSQAQTTTSQAQTTTSQAQTTTSQAQTTTTQAQTTTSQTTTTNTPSTGATNPPSGGNCRATGIWAGQPDKDAWCHENCNHDPPNCDPSMCICD